MNKHHRRLLLYSMTDRTQGLYCRTDSKDRVFLNGTMSRSAQKYWVVESYSAMSDENVKKFAANLNFR